MGTVRYLSAALALLASAPASAATFLVTYTGTLSRGSDDTGTLFAAGTSLVGKSFTAAFTVDDATPGRTLAVSTGRETLSGNGAANPVHGTLTIAGAGPLQFGATRGSLDRIDWGGYDYIYTGANNTIDAATYVYENVQLNLTNYGDFSFLPGSNFNYVVQPGDTGGGSFVLQTLTVATRQNTRYVSGSFDIDRVSISSLAAPVPEPATWAFMLLGFGAIGASLRSTRRKAAAQVAA